MNVLFTGIGGPTPLGLAKATKNAFPKSRLIGLDGSEWAANLYDSEIFDSTYQIVSADHREYWDRIKAIVQKEHIDFAFIVPETEVLQWSAYQKNQKLPCQSWIPDYELATFCFDKNKVAELLYPHGLTPKSFDFESQSNNDLVNRMSYPFWIRVRQGAGALGAMKVANAKELETWLALHNYRGDFMISEFLPGRNYACKLLYQNGELIQHASAERIDYLLSAAAPSGISGMCSRGKLLNRPDLVEKSILAMEIISNKLGKDPHGIFTVDFKEDQHANPLITEINIRHVSFNYAFALGGINFAETTLNRALGLPDVKQASNTFDKESFFIRGVDAPIRLISE